MDETTKFTTSPINAINHGSVKFNWHNIHQEYVAQLMYKVYTL
jgi:hydroxyacyl-ACP dehydratase HTD2-like protein with hotdog domain